MVAVSAELPRFEPMHGWANRILRVDLSDMRIWAQETAPYVPAYLGARGLAARIAWDEYPEPVGEFDPENPLMVMTGALTGSRSPYSGRTNVCAFSPQAYPYHWFTRSSIGGRFGGELKRAGYDGIVVTGASETPVRVRIVDDEVSILPAEELWGLDTMDTLEALEAVEGRGVRSLVIGPAGENRSRIATIQTASSSAAGQGGFGGVMGSKQLKAISVVGTGRVLLAAPELITALAKVLARRFKEAGLDRPRVFSNLGRLNEALAAEGGGHAGVEPCTEGCLTPCAVHFRDMPGVVYGRKWSGSWFCIAGHLQAGPPGWVPPQIRDRMDWHLDRHAGFEMNVLANRYGLNQYDLLVGLVPWLMACQRDGEITDLNGLEMDWDTAETWAHFFRITAYREGLGDVLAEGGWAAAQTLGVGEALTSMHYAGWGQAGHWDGRAVGPMYPYWVVSALQWMSDTRDPFNSGHGSLWAGFQVMGRLSGMEPGEARAVEVDRMRAIGDHLYGSPDAVDPFSGYTAKAPMAHFHTLRAVVVDCVPVDDLTFPCIYEEHATDRYWRFEVDGIGEIEGPSVEYHLFRAGTGLCWSEDEFVRAAERICALERALQVRHWGRDRQTDEMLLPYFEQEDAMQSPFLDRRYALDREQFRPVLDEFYALHGWDERGRPIEETMAALGMGDMHAPMVEGASRAEAGRAEPRERDATI
jgi:aldehyde:ferredoxin oxidoreductase